MQIKIFSNISESVPGPAIKKVQDQVNEWLLATHDITVHVIHPAHVLLNPPSQYESRTLFMVSITVVYQQN